MHMQGSPPTEIDILVPCNEHFLKKNACLSNQGGGSGGEEEDNFTLKQYNSSMSNNHTSWTRPRTGIRDVAGDTAAIADQLDFPSLFWSLFSYNKLFIFQNNHIYAVTPTSSSVRLIHQTRVHILTVWTSWFGFKILTSW